MSQQIPARSHSTVQRKFEIANATSRFLRPARKLEGEATLSIADIVDRTREGYRLSAEGLPDSHDDCNDHVFKMDNTIFPVRVSKNLSSSLGICEWLGAVNLRAGTGSELFTLLSMLLERSANLEDEDLCVDAEES